MPVLLLAFLAFIILGSTEGVRGVTWPSVAQTFDVPLDRLGVMLAFAMSGGLVASASSGRIIRTCGLGLSIRLGLFLIASGATVLAVAPSWPALIGGAVVNGLGCGLVDASLNALFVRGYSARAMSWLHASFGLGTTAGALTVQQIFIHDLSWRLAYCVIGLGGVLIALGFLISFTIRGPSESSREESRSQKGESLFATLKHRQLWLSALLFFVYAGVEITTGEWAFAVLVDRHIDRVTAAGWVGMYWGAFTVGRIAFGFIPSTFPTRTLTLPLMVGVFICAILFASSTSQLAWTASLLGIGFFLGPIFPAVMFDTERRVGAQHLDNAVGLQIAASTIGWAAMPGAAGWVSTLSSLQAIPYFVVVTSMLVLVLYKVTNAAGKN